MPVTAMTRNGHDSSGSRVMRLGDTRPKTLDIEVNERIVHGYLVQTRRFPSTVAGELDDARNEYLERRIPILPDETRPRASLYRVSAAIAALFASPPASPLGASEEERRKLTQEALLTGAAPGSEQLAEALLGLRDALAETEQTRFRVSQRDWEHYVSRCLRALVPEMEQDEIDNLGGDRLRVLVGLGHLEEDVLPDDVLREMVEAGELPQEALARRFPAETGTAAPHATEPETPSREAGASTRPPETGTAVPDEVTTEKSMGSGPETANEKKRLIGASHGRASVASTD